MRKRSWSKEKLIEAVKTSLSFRQVLSKIGLREAGGNYEQLKRYIKEYNLKTKHFKGRGWNRGLKGIGIPKIPLDQILVNDSNFQSFKLKKRLFAAGLKMPKCEQCGWAEKTADGYLPLELYHINS